MADDALPAFDEFYARYHGRLFGFVVSVWGATDAEDVAQEAMVRAYASFAGLHSGRDPWPWLVAIVRNVVRDRCARLDAVPFADVPGSVADATVDVEERHLVRAALGRLSSSDRDVLVLRECAELTFGELSRIYGRSPNTLRQQVFRARQRLAAAYTALGGRALGLAGAWGRWWRDASAPVAAAVVVGTFVMAPAVPTHERVVAGPAVRGGAPTGPATVRAVATRPLQPGRTTRVVVAPTTFGSDATRQDSTARAGSDPATSYGTRLRDDRGARVEERSPGSPLACAVDVLASRACR